MLEEIRTRLRAIPFEPFTIHLADGRTLFVPHQDFVWMPKLGALFYFHDEPGGSERINPLLIVSVRGAAEAAAS
jgi:hypothetical protein